METPRKPVLVKKVFENTRFYLNRLNLYSKNDIFVRSIKIPRFLISALVLLPMMVVFVSICWYCIDERFNLSTTSTTQSFLIVMIQMTLIYTSMAWKNGRIVETVDDLEEFIIGRCAMKNESEQIYSTVSAKQMGVIKAARRFVIIFVLLNYGPLFITPIRYVMLGHPTPDQWHLPTEMKEFLDSNTFFVYYVGWISCMACDISFFSILAVSIALYVMLSLFIYAVCEDIEQTLSNLSNCYSSEELKTRDIKNRLHEILIESTEVHVELVKLMENMSETLSGVLFHQLLGSAVFLAMTFFSLDKSGELNPNVLFAAQDALWCVCVCFLYTYYAENIYKKTSNLADVVYFSSWCAMPTDIQKMTIFLIMQSQKVHRFNCYGIYSVSLANFSLIIRSSISYYLVIRGLE